MCSIASGSSGNCIYAGSDTTHILIDTGISKKRTEEGLAGLELSLRDIDGIFITHEHADHIQGLGVISRKYQIPVYCTEGTKRAILSDKRIGDMDEALFQTVRPDQKYSVKDMVITPIRISHDAAEPTAFKISHGRQRGAVVTDLGVYNDYIVEHLKNLDALLLEANHDVHMLEVGSYPYPLKRRILGNRGHLSNELSGRLLCDILHDGLKHIVLGHLSKENNYARLAYETVKLEVTLGDNEFKGEDLHMFVASRDEVSEILEV